jgi:hypothetical protein
MFLVKDKFTAVVAKLGLLRQCVSHGDLDSFPSLYDFIVGSGDLDADVLETMK